MDGSLNSLDSAVLNEGTKFLFAQLTELLTRFRDRHAKEAVHSPEKSVELTKDGRSTDMHSTTPECQPVTTDALEPLLPRLRDLRMRLSGYVDGLDPVTPTDVELLATVEEARGLLEELWGRKITFRGESRQQSGTSIDVDVRAHSVEGRLVGLRAKNVGASSHFTSRADIGTVHQGGVVIGVEVDSTGIGDS
jgi:hypothetical protein